MILPSGSQLQGGRYRIERELGHGGFGYTYLATQTGLNRKVAIKEFFMRNYCERDANTSQVVFGTSVNRQFIERFRKKFLKEAQNIAMLNHPNIIRIHDVFEENGTAYYVMEYLDKGSLKDLVERKGKLSEQEALNYIKQIAAALGYIHERRMNHLDVKPGNVLIDDNDNVVLIDFGLAKQYNEVGEQTSTTPVGISHGFAPLEQYHQGGVSVFYPATDIYSLGATLYYLVVGEAPPNANIVNDEGLPEFSNSISLSIERTIKLSMQSRRTQRIQNIPDFLKVLDDKLDFLPNKVGPQNGEGFDSSKCNIPKQNTIREINNKKNITNNKELNLFETTVADTKHAEVEVFCDVQNKHRSRIFLSAICILVVLIGGWIVYDNFTDRSMLDSEIKDIRKEEISFDKALELLNSNISDSVKLGFSEMKRLSRYGSDSARVEIGLTYLDTKIELIKNRRTLLNISNTKTNEDSIIKYLSLVNDDIIVMPEVYYTLGIAYSMKENWNKALVNHRKALDLLKNHIEPGHGFESKGMTNSVIKNIKGVNAKLQK